MSNQRQIEIFSADCPVCRDTVEMVNRIACSSCNISVLDMKEDSIAQRAKTLGIHRVPAIVIDGKLAECCVTSAPNEESLRAAGIGKPLSE